MKHGTILKHPSTKKNVICELKTGPKSCNESWDPSRPMPAGPRAALGIPNGMGISGPGRSAGHGSAARWSASLERFVGRLTAGHEASVRREALGDGSGHHGELVIPTARLELNH